MDKATEILKRVHRIELRARRLASETFAGQYQSGVRGQGLDFDDFREYLPGDDPRFIDWKVTARMGSPFVRRFREEREQALILAVDVSASMNYASQGAIASKLETAAEVAAVLAFSAAQSGDKFGLLLMGRGERFYLPPAKGFKQALRIVREIISSQSGGPDEPLSAFADSLLRVQKKSAMVVLISDFLIPTDRPALGKINFKHELIPIRISDPMEQRIPDVGRLIARDPESGELYSFNFDDAQLRAEHEQAVRIHRNEWVKDFQQLGIDYLDITNVEPFIGSLKALFARRARQFTH
jgi:uncharacterized protein (DUF58 family)